jgi:Fuc2NAc and GlcNAc transferase
VMLLLLLKSFLLSFTGAFLAARYGSTIGLADKPNERSSHRVVTPKGGGIGILAAMVMAGIAVGVELGV